MMWWSALLWPILVVAFYIIVFSIAVFLLRLGARDHTKWDVPAEEALEQEIVREQAARRAPAQPIGGPPAPSGGNLPAVG